MNNNTKSSLKQLSKADRKQLAYDGRHRLSKPGHGKVAGYKVGSTSTALTAGQIAADYSN